MRADRGPAQAAEKEGSEPRTAPRSPLGRVSVQISCSVFERARGHCADEMVLAKSAADKLNDDNRAYAAAKLDAFSRNKFRIETSGATTAGPSSIVTINLPEGAVLCLRSFAVHMDVLTTWVRCSQTATRV